jgi:Flp pilus assembly protein TadG
MRNSWTCTTAFTRDDRGGVSILFGLSCLILFVIMGIAIDSARYQDLASRTQTGLDGASLAGAKLLADDDVSVADVQQRARQYFSSVTSTFGVDTASISPLQVDVDLATGEVESSVQIKVSNFFATLAGLDRLTIINRASKVVYDKQNIELALVLDVTGSMNNKNKLGDMKAASADIIDALFDQSVSESHTRIAVAPFSSSVNVGTFRGSVADTTGAVADDCVIERADSTDASPSGANRLKTAPVAPPLGMYSCPDAPIIALQGRSQADAMKTKINAYLASGWTSGHIGAAWGWYLLSPKWGSIFSGASKPRDYDSNKVIKAVVIMTDGDFNAAYLNGDLAPGDPAQADLAYSQFQTLCTGMKDEGIRIFTVGYDLPEGSRPMTELEACATTGDFYAAAAGNLKKVFKDIAESLTALRVSG